MAMTETVKQQILFVRETGRTNMFDVGMVKRIGAEHGYTEMISYIDGNLTGYCNFIMYGDETGEHFSRRLNMFNEKEKRALLIKAERLVKHLQNAVDGTGDPETTATDFDVDLSNFVYDYKNMKKAKR